MSPTAFPRIIPLLVIVRIAPRHFTIASTMNRNEILDVRVTVFAKRLFVSKFTISKLKCTTAQPTNPPHR